MMYCFVTVKVFTGYPFAFWSHGLRSHLTMSTTMLSTGSLAEAGSLRTVP